MNTNRRTMPKPKAALYRRLTLKLPTDAGVRYQVTAWRARATTPFAFASYRDALVRDPQHARSWHNLLPFV